MSTTSTRLAAHAIALVIIAVASVSLWYYDRNRERTSLTRSEWLQRMAIEYDKNLSTPPSPRFRNIGPPLSIFIVFDALIVIVQRFLPRRKPFGRIMFPRLGGTLFRRVTSYQVSRLLAALTLLACFGWLGHQIDVRDYRRGKEAWMEHQAVRYDERFTGEWPEFLDASIFFALVYDVTTVAFGGMIVLMRRRDYQQPDLPN
jgi:hypothetical protein